MAIGRIRARSGASKKLRYVFFYRNTCCFCGHTTEWTPAELYGEASVHKDGISDSLADAKTEKNLLSTAKAKINKQIEELTADKAKHLFKLGFSPECPACENTQPNRSLNQSIELNLNDATLEDFNEEVPAEIGVENELNGSHPFIKDDWLLDESADSGENCAMEIIKTSESGCYEQLLLNSHINIPEIVGIEKESGCLRIKEKLRSGLTLSELLASDRLMKSQLSDILLQICDALIFLHGLYPPVSYNNLLAENVLVAKGDLTILCDLSLLRQGETENDVKMFRNLLRSLPHKFGKIYADIFSGEDAENLRMEDIREELFRAYSAPKDRAATLIFAGVILFTLLRRVMRF